MSCHSYGLDLLCNVLTWPHKLKSLDLDGLAQYIESGRCKQIVVMVGAGISVSAG